MVSREKIKNCKRKQTEETIELTGRGWSGSIRPASFLRRGQKNVGDNEHPNDYPSQYAFAALFSHLLDWVRKGIVPPEAPRIEVDEALENVRDENGNAVGGVRLPCRPQQDLV